VDWSVRGFAEHVNEVIKSLSLQNVIIVGHSLAGDINMMAVSSRPGPVIGFIGIDNFKNAATPLPPQYQQQARPFSKNSRRILPIRMNNMPEWPY
jgi:sigma-B regulation protein RsbQ